MENNGKKRIFLDLDGTLAKFSEEPNALQRFATEKGFFANLKPFEGIEIINELAKQYNLYVLSASPNPYADEDKIAWVHKYLPNIEEGHILICRNGDCKAFYLYRIGLHIDKACYLLDDYTENLEQWETYGGTGIKRITKDADNSTGKWVGLILKQLEELGNLIA